MAFPHPCLLILALSVVVGLAIAPAMSNSATAIQSRENSPPHATFPAEPQVTSASTFNSLAAAGDRRNRPVQAGSSPLPPETAVPVEGFEGLHFGANGPFTIRLTPPDVQVAVGPHHVVEMVNVLGRISTKQGVEVRSFPLDSFFGVPSTDFISDPKIHFDLRAAVGSPRLPTSQRAASCSKSPSQTTPRACGMRTASPRSRAVRISRSWVSAISSSSFRQTTSPRVRAGIHHILGSSIGC